MKSKYSIKYFPFAPGIPWKIKNGKYIQPQIDFEIWNSSLEGKEIVITAFGGLIESYMSLTYIEALRSLKHRGKISWLGNKKYTKLVHAQGLATISTVDGLNTEVLGKYPTPLFFDAKNRAFFNCLNNYIITKSYYGQHPKVNKNVILDQIFSNSMMNWDYSYFPEFRKFRNISEPYRNWAQSNRFADNKKFVLIFPDRGCNSMHQEKCLDWGVMQVKEAAALFKASGFKVVVCSNNLHLYHGTDVYRTMPEISIVINLIKKAWLVLSESIDYLMLSLATSRAIILSRQLPIAYDLFEAAEFLGKDNIITIDKHLSPIDVSMFCEGLNG